MRRYMSKRQRPCDFCRSRKSACRIEGSLPCRLCVLHGTQCTFVESTQPRRRTMPLESNDAIAWSLGPGAEGVEIPQPNIRAISPEDRGDPNNVQLEESLDNPSPDLLFGSFDDQYFRGFGETQPDVQYSQHHPVPGGELDPGDHLTNTNVREFTAWLGADVIGTQLDANDSLHPQVLGHSSDMDPYLLQNYRYDTLDAYKFKQLSIHSVSNGHNPTQFLLSEPGLFSHSRVEMALHHSSPETSREDLETLVSLDTGMRLIALFRRLILPQCPIFSDSVFPDPKSTPPYLLAAIYLVAQPFAKLDDVLSIELAYEDLSNQGLFKIINEALHWEAHNPSLSLVQTMLLLILRPSTDPLVLDSSFKWALHGTLVTTCQTLGLHHDPSSWNIAPWQITLRRRISSVVFSLDKWLAASLGRPPLIAQDAWLVTSLVDVDGHASSMNPEAWSQYVCYARLGLLLGQVLSKLFSLTAVNELATNLPKTLEVSKQLLEELSSWHSQSLQQALDPAEQGATMYTVSTLGYHYVQMTIFRAIIRPFITVADSNTGPINNTGHLARDQRDVMGFARTGVRSATTSAINFVKSLKEEHFHMFWPHWSQVALSCICFLDLMMATTSADTHEAAAWFRDLHAARKEMRLKSNMLPILRLGLLRIDAVFWKGIDNVVLLKSHVKEGLQASLQPST